MKVLILFILLNLLIISNSEIVPDDSKEDSSEEVKAFYLVKEDSNESDNRNAREIEYDYQDCCVRGQRWDEILKNSLIKKRIKKNDKPKTNIQKKRHIRFG